MLKTPKMIVGWYALCSQYVWKGKWAHLILTSIQGRGGNALSSTHQSTNTILPVCDIIMIIRPSVNWVKCGAHKQKGWKPQIYYMAYSLTMEYCHWYIDTPFGWKAVRDNWLFQRPLKIGSAPLLPWPGFNGKVSQSRMNFAAWATYPPTCSGCNYHHPWIISFDIASISIIVVLSA